MTQPVRRQRDCRRYQSNGTDDKSGHTLGGIEPRMTLARPLLQSPRGADDKIVGGTEARPPGQSQARSSALPV